MLVTTSHGIESHPTQRAGWMQNCLIDVIWNGTVQIVIYDRELVAAIAHIDPVSMHLEHHCNDAPMVVSIF